MPFQSVPVRQLGAHGPTVPALGFGLMNLSGAYGPQPNDEERFQVLDRAAELGSTFWDTSNIYGDNEELIGKWFAKTGKRGEIFVATKFGIILEGRSSFRGVDSSGENCRKACEESLKKLGVKCIDLYYAHAINPVTPIEETVRAMAELKAAGKIKHLGLCGISSSTLRRAHAIHPITAVQTEYSPFIRKVENESSTNLLATCRELGVGVVCNSPLGRGLLTGTVTSAASVAEPGDIRGTHLAVFNEENIVENVKLANKFKRLAEQKGCSASQLALAWLLKQGGDILPIPGTRKAKYLEDNWAALEVELSAAEEAEVRALVERAELKGTQVEGTMKQFEYVDTKEEET